MRLVTFDELPDRLHRDAAALQLGAFSGYFSREAIATYRRRSHVFSGYVALFAVDRGTVVGEVFVLRLPFRTRSGVEPVAGIASVTTAVPSSRRGVAARILEEVHRREAAAGIRFALLWTSQAWRAHGLYERLGYRDVFVSPVAARLAPGRRALRRGDTLRPATARELPRLEGMHRAACRGRLGFSVRPEHHLAVEQACGFLDLPAWLVFRRSGRWAGYVHLVRGPTHARLGELVASGRDRIALLDAVERTVRRGAIVVNNSVALDLRAELLRRGYLVRRGADWRTLMAKPLLTSMSPAAVRRELGVDDRSFVVMDADRF